MSSNVFMNNQLERIADYIDAGKAGGGSLTVNLSGVGDMTGATAGTAGTHGLVPAPAAGDQDKTLHGDGTWRADTAVLPQVFGSSSGSVIILTDAADYAASDLVIDIDPVQSGSGDPSPDNIRPISGWTGANISIGGENIYTSDGVVAFNATNTVVQASGTTLRVYSKVKNVAFQASRQLLSNYNLVNGKTYLITADVSVVSGTPRIGIRDSSSRITHSAYVLNDGKLSVIFTKAANDVTLSFFATWVEDSEGDITYSNIMFSEIEKVYPITFPTEAGTVYGGTLDVTNGVLTVTKANIASYAGETLPGAWISDRDVYDPDNPTTPTTGAQVVYDLNTPLTYQVISTDVYLTSGTCCVWADTGDIITLEYIKADYNDLMQAVPKMKMPDYSAVIASGTYNQPGTVYTATQDCFIYLEYSYIGTPCYIDVDGATVARLWISSGQSQAGSLIPLKAGNVVTSHGGNDTLPYAVYPII